MIQLSLIKTEAPNTLEKSHIIKRTEELAKIISDLQHILYAQQKHSLLVILQGMDASGKDGTTQEVFGKCTPGAVKVYGFKKPTEEEMSHDFLWRVHKHAPEKGYIQVFNRSHYEDILIQRVHGWIDMERVEKRMAAINAFEELLTFDNNTTVLKFYLHISEARQLEKLQERIDDPLKNWKHNDGDWKERPYWKQYMEAYEYAINQSSIPWQIIPADKKWYRNYLVAEAVAKALLDMKLELPSLPPKTE